ncbi:MAG TPA: acetyl-CoA C-acyltransferase [Candidatus Kapabacteria bacterium]|nr:acetyl-CoA C-acyltransferase [Candidatus Kapabacteria bacterium]
MSDAFIISPIRTPIGRYGGALSVVRADDLAAIVLKNVIERTGVPADRVDDVIMGCANQAGEDNRNVARMAVLLAGFPQEVPATTINRLCGSALDALIYAVRSVKAGEADIVIAGGVEVMSRAPYAIAKNVSGAAQFGNLTAFDTALGWRFPNARLEAMFPLEQMGETAENVAEQWNIGREEQDAFALRSHRLAVAAWEAGRYDNTVVPVEIPQRKGEPIVVRRDEGPRADTTLEKLAALKPAFRKGGTVTPGNSSSLNDGAAAVIIASERAVKEFNLVPVLRYVASGTVGLDPRIMGVGPVAATRKALKAAGLAIGNLDLVELNEAFASQSLAVMRDLELDPEKVNVNGGAIALGHPLGMSGVRLVATLGDEMSRRAAARYGLASMCIGVGQGISAIFEKA